MKYVFILGYGLIIFIIQEVLFRIFFPLPELSNFSRADILLSDNTEINQSRLWYQKAFYNSIPDTAHRFLHNYNGYGFRDQEWDISKAEGQTRILFVGDSFVEGAMAEQDSSIPAVFKSNLEDDQYDVLNSGMIGIGFKEYLNLLNSVVPVFKPDVVLMVLYANDAPTQDYQLPQEAFVPTYFNPFELRIFSLIKLLKNNTRLPFRWHKSLPLMEAVPGIGNTWTKHESELAPHVTPEMAQYMKLGQYNFHHINWVIKEEYFLKRRANFSQYLTPIKKFLDSYGSKLVVAYVPSRHQVSTYYYPFELPTCQKLCPPEMDLTTREYQVNSNQLVELCANLDVPFFDMTQIVLSYENRQDHLYWDYDDHMRKKGYQIIGQELAKQWTALHL